MNLIEKRKESITIGNIYIPSNIIRHKFVVKCQKYS